MTALVSPKSKHCSQLSMLSGTTRKAIRAELRQRITDEHPDIARQADGASEPADESADVALSGRAGKDGAAQQDEGGPESDRRR